MIFTETKQNGKVFIRTKRELAKRLDLEESNLKKNYMDRDGFPKRIHGIGWDLEEVQAFMTKYKEEVNKRKNPTLRDEKLKVEIEREKVKLDILLGNYYEKNQADKEVMQTMTRFRAIIENWRKDQSAMRPSLCENIDELANKLLSKIESEIEECQQQS